jgi:uncharacterized membrane protein
MAYIHAISAGHLEWISYAAALLVGVLPDKPSMIVRMGFGRRGFGGRHGVFRLFRIFRLVRILFVLLFTTVFGPVVLVALLVFMCYWFFTSRRGR